VLAEKIQSFNSAGCRMDIVSMSGQHGLQKVAVHAVVIDDKDFDHGQRSAEDLKNTAALHRAA
jgi:hypothetical protein